MHVVVVRKIFCTWGYCLVLKKVPNKHISQFSCNGAEFRFKRVTDCICLQLRIPKILPLADLQQSVLKYHKGHTVSLFVLAPARFIVSIPLTYFLHSFSWHLSVYWYWCLWALSQWASTVSEEKRKDSTHILSGRTPCYWRDYRLNYSCLQKHTLIVSWISPDPKKQICSVWIGESLCVLKCADVTNNDRFTSSACYLCEG